MLGLIVGLVGLMPIAMADEGAREKVLGLRIEGSGLTNKDRTDLFSVLQARLTVYPQLELVQPPEGEITDEMIDLECIDLDVECLTKVGAKRGATKVVYVHIYEAKRGLDMLMRLVGVGSGEALYEDRVNVSRASKLGAALGKQIKAAFGDPPVKKETKGTLLIQATPPGARIYVDGHYVGAGSVKLKWEQGTYDVRVTRPGYQEQLFKAKVEPGKRSRNRVALTPIPDPPKRDVVAVDAPAESEGTPVYKKWWFWTGLGAVALTTVAIAVASAGDDVSTGDLMLSVGSSDAWKDAGIPGASEVTGLPGGEE